jgi:PAS domain S-box-containing protein
MSEIPDAPRLGSIRQAEVRGPEELAARARLAAIVESSDDAIVSKTLDGIITSWNRAAERILGYAAADAIGRPMTLIIPPARIAEEAEILARLRAGHRVEHFETVRMCSDGRLIDVAVTISPVCDEAGRIVGASKILRDVTAQRAAQRELVEARRQAEESRRQAEQARGHAEDARHQAEAAREQAEAANRSKDLFLSVLSHELRTPLTPALATLGALELAPDLTADVRDQIAMVRRNVETESRLLDDLLDVSRIANGKVQLHFEVVDAHTILRAVVAMSQPDVAAKRIAVTLALRARQPQIWADPGRFQQMLLNLVGNAVKFTPTGGDILIRTSDGPGRVEIQVADTGVGIEADMLPRLFSPFEQGEKTVTRRFGGLGLGLSIVKSLADLHHATISAASPGKGQGATFTLAMRALSDSAPHSHVVSAPAAPTASTSTSPPGTAYPGSAPAGEPQVRCNVLLVEDHDDTRRVLSRLLQTFGCRVTAAGSVREARDIADGTEEAFDLLLSDIGLPDGTGHEVMRYLQRRHPTPGIAISGFGQDEDLARSKEAGFAVHLTKPIAVQTLRTAITQYAGRPA